MPTDTALHQLGATELAEAIRKRSLSSREAVTAHLERIEAVNPAVGAVTATLADAALAAAEAADSALARGEPAGPLHGVPITVKENIDVEGSATTWGAAGLAGQIAPEDAPQVSHLRAAGAIPIARTNMPDFAIRWHTDSGVAGPTRNPWDPALTPGGSSGGEAAALICGMTPLGLGNDLGGSLRWPAQCCGISSLKPTAGRVPDAATTIPTDPTMAIGLFNVQGPMGRSIADVRLAFELMAAPSGRDPKYIHVPAAASGPRPRVAVARDPGAAGVDPQVAASLDSAVKALTDAGYDVDELDPPGVLDCMAAWGALLAADLRALEPLIGGLMSAGTKTFFDIAAAGLPDPEPAGIVGAFVERHRLQREWEAFQSDHPLVLAPICTEPAFPVGDDLRPERALPFLTAMRMVVAVNLLGLPAAAVAIAGAKPAAVQVIGPRFREDLCLDAAASIEATVGRPQVMEPRPLA